MSPTSELRLGPNFSVRPGMQVQAWTELLQDRLKLPMGAGDGNYAFNIYIRRARIFFAGTIFKKVSYLILTEAANLGRTVTNAADGSTTKGSTFNILDAYLSLNLQPEFTIQAGSMLVPFTRQTLQSTTTYISLDIMTTSATYLAALQTLTLRDIGIQFKGIINDHFEYRIGMFQGLRQSSTQLMGAQGGKNAPRFTGYLQYNFLDPEAGYVFPGQTYGHKNTAGVAVGADYQTFDGDVATYWGTSASAFFGLRLSGDPKNGGDEIAGLVQYLHFKSSQPVRNAAGGFGDQDDLGVELSFYKREIKTSLFGKFELKMNNETRFQPTDLRIYGGGVKYLINEAYFNIGLGYNRITTPKAAETFNDQNQVLFVMNFYYF